MLSSSLLTWGFLACLVVLFPQDAATFGSLVYYKTRLVILNAVMFVKAYLLYQALKKDLATLGMALPPFRFTPLWERD